MSFAAGTRFGSYELTSAIGAGGMGEVYRATDTRLKRQVAIKVLPASVASDGDRLARFQREAEVLAALNHPGIAAIYGIEDVGESKALVMELVEGPTLADRLAQSQGAAPRGLPLDEVLSIARQLANALEAAHEQGIIHRDLKPANIKVREDGIVKVLDFGLAKALGGEVSAAGASGASISPTITSPAMTQMGVILGTAAYMAPEQARGKRVDKRADIWAFGVVVYEMITGRRLFGGDDLAETLAQVLMKEPDLGDIPQQLRPLLDHCLRKDPAKRLRDFSSVELLLETTSAPVAHAGRGIASRWLWPLGAVALGGIAAAGWLRAPSPRPSPVALSILPPAGLRLDAVGGLGGVPLISPDGSAVLYHAQRATYVRRLDTLEPTLVPGSQQFTNEAFWGADSTTIYYPAMTLGGWFRLRFPDGVPELLARSQSWSRSGSTSASGTILLSDAGDLLLLDVPGGTPAKLDFSALGPVIVEYPEFLPDGNDFIFHATPRDGRESGIYLAGLQGHTVIDARRLLVNDTAGRYTPAGGGRLLFVRNDTLYAQRLDLTERKLVGDVATVQTGVGSGVGGGIDAADFSVSRTGTIVWRPGITARSQVTAFDRHGAVVGTSGPAFSGSSLALAPDERRLLVSDDVHRWVIEVGQPGIVQAGTWESLWSPDGSGFLGAKDAALWQRPAAGGEPVRVADLNGTLATISADASQVIYLRANLDAMIQKIRGTPAERTPRLLIATNADGYAQGVQFSPDGRWVVYRQGGLFVQSTSGSGLRHQIATDGRTPRWRADGKEILAELYGAVISIPVDGNGPEPRFGEPQTLFRDTLRTPANSNSSSSPLAVSRDGSTIYWLQGVPQPGPDVIHVRTNAVSF